MRARQGLIGLAAALALLCGVIVASGSAQSPVSTPPAEGCDQIAQYIADRQEADDAMRADWAERFPGVAYPSDMSDDEFERFLLGLTPEEFAILADHWLYRAELFEKMDVPAIVQPYHELTVERAKVRASAYRTAVTVGVVVAGMTYSEALDQIVEERSAYSVLALEVCPAFMDILIFNEEIIATPVPS